ncbi:unnamed protein product [Lupinus luteus]|uniref:Uncharacterized protein n=1 Tax=Lupinus luteus TaxID=3873 RepID=A0AAV1VYR9_LUPLU
MATVVATNPPVGNSDSNEVIMTTDSMGDKCGEQLDEYPEQLLGDWVMKGNKSMLASEKTKTQRSDGVTALCERHIYAPATTSATKLVRVTQVNKASDLHLITEPLITHFCIDRDTENNEFYNHHANSAMHYSYHEGLLDTNAGRLDNINVDGCSDRDSMEQEFVSNSQQLPQTHILRDRLISLHASIRGPWMIIGDVNEILSPNEVMAGNF